MRTISSPFHYDILDHNRTRPAQLSPKCQEFLADRSVILASNRGPIDYAVSSDGRILARRGSGGVVTALGALARYANVTWVATAMSHGDRIAAQIESPPRPSYLPTRLKLASVVTSESTFHLHYNVFSNPLLWFTHHYLWNVAYGPSFDKRTRRAWNEGYVAMNQAFADTIGKLVSESSTQPVVMIHDYQLYLVAGKVRAQHPDILVSHFVHTPWPAASYWQLLPQDVRSGIVGSLCAADLVGFQTPRCARHFLESCREFLPDCDVDVNSRRVWLNGRETRVGSYPISVDVSELRHVARSVAVSRFVERLRTKPSVYTIVRVDRLDPSKNIIRGFQAFEAFLESHPSYVGRVRFLAFLIPSRTRILEYRQYGQEVFSTIDRINARFRTPDWTPIEVFYQNDYYHALAGMRLADVVMVNPVIDGMNLVAKEAAIVNARDGVLILSEGAGAYQQLSGGALTISPTDVEGTAQAIYHALTMPQTERTARLAILRQAVEEQDLAWWVEQQVLDLLAIGSRRGTEPVPLFR